MNKLILKLIKALPGDGFINKALAIQCMLYAIVVPAFVLAGVDVTYNDSADIKWIGIGLLAVAAYSALLGLSRKLKERYLRGKVVGIAGNISLPQAVALAIGSGVTEEVVFRGLLQTHLGLIVASVLFGAIHWDRAVKVYPLVSGVIGLGLGLVTIASGSLVPAIVIHVVNNFVAFLYAKKAYRKMRDAMAEKARELRRESEVAKLLGEDKASEACIKAIEEVRALREEVKDLWLPKRRFYLIKEWDDTVNKVEVVGVDRDTESVTMRYDDGVTHTVSAQYFRSVEHKALPC